MPLSRHREEAPAALWRAVPESVRVASQVRGKVKHLEKIAQESRCPRVKERARDLIMDANRQLSQLASFLEEGTGVICKHKPGARPPRRSGNSPGLTTKPRL
jgi:hypothetical protein